MESVDHVTTRADRSSIRDAYGRLLAELGSKVNESRNDIKKLIDNVSTKLTGPLPGTKMPGIPLNPVQDDFPGVRFWDPSSWNALRKGYGGETDPETSAYSAFMEDQFGRAIPEAERSSLRSDFYSFFVELFNKGNIPAGPSRVDFTAKEEYRIIIEGKYPWLRLCDGSWKFAQAWTNTLGIWKRDHLPKLTRQKAMAIAAEQSPIEITSSEDDKPRPRKRGPVIEIPTDSSSASSKRGRDDEQGLRSSKKHKAVESSRPFHPTVSKKAKGKRPMRFAQVSTSPIPRPIRVSTEGTQVDIL